MLYTVNTIESIANKLVTIIPIFLFFCFTSVSNFLLGFSTGIIGNIINIEIELIIILNITP